MKKIIIFCLTAIFAGNLFSQQYNIDSLVNVLETQKTGDTEISIEIELT